MDYNSQKDMKNSNRRVDYVYNTYSFSEIA